MPDACPIIVLGAGSHGRVVADVARALGHDVRGFVDNDPDLLGRIVTAAPVLGTIDDLGLLARAHDVRHVAVAIGDNHARLACIDTICNAGLALATLVHPDASVAGCASLGAGTVVCRGASVCVEATLGRACLVNTNAVVDHECRLGDAVHVCPNASLAGRVTLDEGVMIGLNACVLPCLTVGAWSVVGAGAAVVRDVAAGVVVTGVPARPSPSVRGSRARSKRI